MKVQIQTSSGPVDVDINGRPITINMRRFDIKPVDVSEVDGACYKGYSEGVRSVSVTVWDHFGDDQ